MGKYQIDQIDQSKYSNFYLNAGEIICYIMFLVVRVFFNKGCVSEYLREWQLKHHKGL
jgi:hypothetical protein